VDSAWSLLRGVWDQFYFTMNRQGIWALSVMAGLGLGYHARANSIPTVTINDTTGPITVTHSSGFSSFASGTIGGNPEAIWWYGTANNLGTGTSSGIWTEPGSSKISDEFYVSSSTLMIGGVPIGGMAYGVFLSDPAVLPSTFTIPGTSIVIDLSKIGFTSSVETGTPTQISPTSALSVIATSSVPDGGSTLILLGLGMGAIVWFAKGRGRSATKV